MWQQEWRKGGVGKFFRGILEGGTGGNQDRRCIFRLQVMLGWNSKEWNGLPDGLVPQRNFWVSAAGWSEGTFIGDQSSEEEELEQPAAAKRWFDFGWNNTWENSPTLGNSLDIKPSDFKDAMRFFGKFCAGWISGQHNQMAHNLATFWL